MIEEVQIYAWVRVVESRAMRMDLWSIGGAFVVAIVALLALFAWFWR